MKVVIALGSNLGDSIEILKSAIKEIAKIMRVEKVSTFIETAPVGGPEQPNYINTVLIGNCEKEPLALLHETQEIENKFGRVREVRWGARTLDIDLIVAGDWVIDIPELQLPHPRARERTFVLQPWLEIEPDASIPGYGRIDALLAEIERAE